VADVPSQGVACYEDSSSPGLARELYYQQVDMDSSGSRSAGADAPWGHATAETRAPIPAGWERIWSGDHGVHYFWHSASRTACWFLNLAAPDGAIEGGGEAAGAAVLGLDRAVATADDEQVTMVSPGHATAATRAALPAGWETAWSEAHQEPFFWHPTSRLARWTLNLAAAARAFAPPPWPHLLLAPPAQAHANPGAGVQARGQDSEAGDSTLHGGAGSGLTMRQSFMLAQLEEQVRAGRAPALAGRRNVPRVPRPTASLDDCQPACSPAGRAL